MSTNHTPNYALSLWEASDQVTRVEFNENHTKIDAALQGLEAALAGKAAQSAISTLQSSLSSLQGSLSALQTTVARKQDTSSALKVTTGTYTGTGTAGSGSPNTLDFASTLGRAPALVIVRPQDDATYGFIVIRGMTSTYSLSENRGGDRKIFPSWSGTRFSWYAPYPAYQLNNPGTVYCYFAVG